MSTTSRELLDSVYSRLGFSGGDLADATDRPNDSTAAAWVDKGDWLTLAKKVKAEKIFFVDNYPVIVFAEQTSTDPAAWVQHFNSAWCMARPQLLFLARQGELSVFNLTARPARKTDDRNGNERLLDAVRTTTDVQQKLARYRRDQVESGRLFEDRRFGSNNRADRALIRDLGEVRRRLIDSGLSPSHAHTLIARSIFIRYLEDRGVLIEEYFRRVAKPGGKEWSTLLDDAIATAPMTASTRKAYYPCVLRDKAFRVCSIKAGFFCG